MRQRTPPFRPLSDNLREAEALAPGGWPLQAILAAAYLNRGDDARLREALSVLLAQAAEELGVPPETVAAAAAPLRSGPRPGP